MARQFSVVVVLFGCALAGTAEAAQQGGIRETVETVRDRDVNGSERVSQEVVTRSSETGGRMETVIETYVSDIEKRLALRQRVHRVSTATSDGSETVEHTETVPLASPGDKMRVTKRSVTTVRRSGPDVCVRERREFELDVNGRFVPTLTVVEHISGE